jgi:hypothetical protein
MGLVKWMARVGGPGSAARWAAKSYRTLRAGHPGYSKLSDMEIFRLIIASRYAVLPSRWALAYLEGWMSNGDIGLRSLVTGILQAEHRIDHLPKAFAEAIDEELAKSGLPETVISGPLPRDDKSSLNDDFSTKIIECEGCEQRLRVPVSTSPLRIRCPSCSEVFLYQSSF